MEESVNGFGKVFMLKRFSILSATLVIVVGTIFGFANPASATSLPHYGFPAPPVNVAHSVKAPKVYVVKKGDSLYEIAVRFHLLDWKKLYCENRKVIGSEPWMIQPKMRLVIKKAKNLCDVPFPVVRYVSKPQVPKALAVQDTLSTQGSMITYSGFGSFQACVISRESGGNPRAYNSSSGASGLYGMLLSTWDSLGLGYPGGAYTAPVSVQNEGFSILYARDGTSPWAPYDGC